MLVCHSIRSVWQFWMEHNIMILLSLWSNFLHLPAKIFTMSHTTKWLTQVLKKVFTVFVSDTLLSLYENPLVGYLCYGRHQNGWGQKMLRMWHCYDLIFIIFMFLEYSYIECLYIYWNYRILCRNIRNICKTIAPIQTKQYK